ncbi:hypothetical protein Tsubulata_031687 [Turnera subulata]|uniref:Dirigent protein n=1 Tax=Turnera subulata TaxID=218843 RepID=A0A9Q0J3X1_9ROSI|nr:hypothetical protein Tsubulata_031687 [Turnera subulata]
MARAIASLNFKIFLLQLQSSSAIIQVTAEHEEDFVKTHDARLLGLDKREQKLTHLHFYFHDILSGPNPTAVTAVPPLSKTSTTWFGSICMLDHKLTAGPQITSKLIGRAQGLYAGTSEQDLTLLMAINIVFLEGAYNGSTITILGRNSVFSKVREMPIIGGTGVFRFATRYVQASTYTYNKKTGNAVFFFVEKKKRHQWCHHRPVGPGPGQYRLHPGIRPSS